MKTNAQVIAPEIKQAQKEARVVTAKMRRVHILVWAKQAAALCPASVECKVVEE